MNDITSAITALCNQLASDDWENGGDLPIVMGQDIYGFDNEPTVEMPNPLLEKLKTDCKGHWIPTRDRGHCGATNVGCKNCKCADPETI